jgi:hypothetical protein
LEHKQLTAIRPCLFFFIICICTLRSALPFFILLANARRYSRSWNKCHVCSFCFSVVSHSACLTSEANPT